MNSKRFSQEDLAKLRKINFANQPGFIRAEDILSPEIGAIGTEERKEFDAKAWAWYYGEVIRDRRKELGITQKDLAERIGRERTYINRIEKGETDLQLSSFLRITNALGIRIHLENL